MARKSIQERFWLKVDRSGDCWIWMACRNGSTPEHSYGRFRINGQTFHAHRIAWELTKGTIPEGLRVLHRCDNPPCCNPRHLFLGSQADNMQDCATKNRTTRGSRNARAKLTSIDVLSIRSDPRPQIQIAATYNVDTSLICKIKRRKNWTHLP